MYPFTNLEPVHCSTSGSNCCFLTHIQISQEASKVVWYSHLLKNFPQFDMIRTVKGFGVASRAEVNVCLEFSCFFYDPTDVSNLTSSSSAFSKSSFKIWRFSVHILLKPNLGNFEKYIASMWDEMQLSGSWNILLHRLSLRLEWKLTFSSPGATAEFSIFAGTLSAALSQHHLQDLKYLTCCHNSTQTFLLKTLGNWDS